MKKLNHLIFYVTFWSQKSVLCGQKFISSQVPNSLLNLLNFSESSVYSLGKLFKKHVLESWFIVIARYFLQSDIILHDIQIFLYIQTL